MIGSKVWHIFAELQSQVHILAKISLTDKIIVCFLEKQVSSIQMCCALGSSVFRKKMTADFKKPLDLDT
jgi:hypothetical protein